MPTLNHPLRFTPLLKRLIWGGTKLGSVLGKPIGPEDDYAESWELSDHGTDQSVVVDGPFAGRTLHELITEFPSEMLGPTLADRTQFPLLIKFLDAAQTLSVQVHPNDELGKILVNDNGKTECWVILQSEPNSVLYAGLKEGVTRNQFAKAMEEGGVEPLLHRFHPEPGDCVFIPAGTVHAIGAGILLAEIQQMSNATFRIHDWGRMGTDGKPRQLHLEESLQAIDFNAGPVQPCIPQADGVREALVRCRYFHLDRLTVSEPTAVGCTDRFTILMNVGGAATVESNGTMVDLQWGDTLLLPATAGECRILPQSKAIILSCTLP